MVDGLYLQRSVSCCSFWFGSILHWSSQPCTARGWKTSGSASSRGLFQVLALTLSSTDTRPVWGTTVVTLGPELSFCVPINVSLKNEHQGQVQPSHGLIWLDDQTPMLVSGRCLRVRASLRRLSYHLWWSHLQFHLLIIIIIVIFVMLMLFPLSKATQEKSTVIQKVNPLLFMTCLKYQAL